MLKENSSKGRNPFDRYITKSYTATQVEQTPTFETPMAPSTETSKNPDVSELWERMQQAQKIAERQRRYTQVALHNEKTDNKQSKESNSSVSRLSSQKKSFEDYLLDLPHNLWKWSIIGTWLWLSGYVMMDSILSGSIGRIGMGTLLCSLMVYPARLIYVIPELFGSVTRGGGRSSSNAV